MDQKTSIQNQFGPVAAHYAASSVHADGPDLQAMVAAAALQGHERVLDIGCGTGHTSLSMARQAAEVIGVDLTLAMLAQARRLAKERNIANATFQHGDATTLPFPDASFDLVTSRYSAHHYSYPIRVLSEVRRVLKPGGAVLLVDVMAPDAPASDTFLNAVELLRDPSHVRDHTVAQWQAMFDSAGLPSAVLGNWPLRLEFESWVARMNTPFLAITQIRALLDGAPREVRQDLAVEQEGYSFSVPVALLRGHLA